MTAICGPAICLLLFMLTLSLLRYAKPRQYATADPQCTGSIRLTRLYGGYRPFG